MKSATASLTADRVFFSMVDLSQVDLENTTLTCGFTCEPAQGDLQQAGLMSQVETALPLEQ